MVPVKQDIAYYLLNKLVFYVFITNTTTLILLKTLKHFTEFYLYIYGRIHTCVHICIRQKLWGGAWEKLKGEQGAGNDDFFY